MKRYVFLASFVLSIFLISSFVSGYAFGGMINSNTESCPSGYTSQQFTNSYSYCYKNSEEAGLYDFGGVYLTATNILTGVADPSRSQVNSITNSLSCPAGFDSISVPRGLLSYWVGSGLSAMRVTDIVTINVCQRTHQGTGQQYPFFGGLTSLITSYDTCNINPDSTTGFGNPLAPSGQVCPVGYITMTISYSYSSSADSRCVGGGATLSCNRICPNGEPLDYYEDTIINVCSQSSNPVPQQLTCTPSNPSPLINSPVSFVATGGTGTYSWSAPGASTTFGSTNPFSTSYTSTGTKTVTVTSGTQTAQCAVDVSYPVLTCMPSSQTLQVNTLAPMTAVGGTGTYSWSAPGASATSGSGQSFSTSYSSAGTNTVTVTSGTQTAQCSVITTEEPVQESSITGAKWVNSQDPTIEITEADINANVVMAGETFNYPAETIIHLDVVRNGDTFTKISLGDYPLDQVDPQRIGLLRVPRNIKEINGVVSGDKLKFTLIPFENGLPNVQKKKESGILTVTSSCTEPNPSCCTKPSPTPSACSSKPSRCEDIKHDPSACNGAQISSPYSTYLRDTCEIQQSDCVYNAQTGTCQERIKITNSNCVLTVQNIVTGTCIDGKRSVHLTLSPSGSCSSCPATSRDYEVPCGRSVALLPFFTILQLVLAVGVIIAIYFIIFKSKKKR